MDVGYSVRFSVVQSHNSSRSVLGSGLCECAIHGLKESGKATGLTHRPCGKTIRRFGSRLVAPIQSKRLATCTASFCSFLSRHYAKFLEKKYSKRSGSREYATPTSNHPNPTHSFGTPLLPSIAACKVYAEVSSDPSTPWRRDSNDGTFWMVFSDFVRLFTKVHLCRVFPDEEYRQYCIHGERGVMYRLSLHAVLVLLLGLSLSSTFSHGGCVTFLSFASNTVFCTGEWSGKTAGGSAKPMRRGSVSRLQKDGQVRRRMVLNRPQSTSGTKNTR